MVAISLLIGANVLYFGGNALLDLWQVAGPGTSFSGIISDHKHIVIPGETGDEYNVIVVDKNAFRQAVLKATKPSDQGYRQADYDRIQAIK